MMLNRFRNYIGYFDRAHLESNKTLVRFGAAPGEGAVDSGENITFNQSVLAGCATAFEWNADSLDLNLNDCSVDFVGTVFWLKRGYKKITIKGGHIEAIGGARAHDGIGGLFLYDSTNPSDAGTYTTLKVSEVSMLDEQHAKLFRNTGVGKAYADIDWEFRRRSQTNARTSHIFISEGPILAKVNHAATQRTPFFLSESENIIKDYRITDRAANIGIDHTAGVTWSVVSDSALGHNALEVGTAPANACSKN